MQIGTLQMKRLSALFIMLLILGGYLGFYLVPTLQGEKTIIKPYIKGDQDEKASCSDFVDALKHTGLGYKVDNIFGTPIALRDIKSPKDTIYLAIDIERGYQDSEIDALVLYWLKGGSIIVADNGLLANNLSNRFGITFLGDPVLEFMKNGSGSSEFSANAGDYNLELHNPTLVYSTFNGDFPPEPSITGSSFYFVDKNRNGLFDSDEIAGPYGEFGFIMDYGRLKSSPGYEVFISDSNIFTNKMFNQGGNATAGNNGKFLVDIIKDILPDGGQLFFDESRHIGTPFIGFNLGTIVAFEIMMSNWRENAFIFLGMALVLTSMVTMRKRQRIGNANKG